MYPPSTAVNEVVLYFNTNASQSWAKKKKPSCWRILYDVIYVKFRAWWNKAVDKDACIGDKSSKEMNTIKVKLAVISWGRRGLWMWRDTRRALGMLAMFCLLTWAVVTCVFLLYNSLLSDTYVCILNPPNILKYGHLRMKKPEARTLVYYSYFSAL